MYYPSIVALVGIVFIGTTALAHDASPSSQITPSASSSSQASSSPSVTLSTATTPSPKSSPTQTLGANLDFTATTTAPLGWLRFRRLLSFDEVKDSQLTLAITNRLLAQAQNQQTTQPSRATATLDSFTKETAALQTHTAGILTQKQNPQVAAFLDQFFADKTAQLARLENLKPAAATALSQKITTSRAKTLEQIVEILEKPGLTPAEQKQKLDQIMQKYTEKESQLDQKIAKKLALKDDLDNETDDEELEDGLAEAEDEALTEASEKLDKDELADFADELSRKEGGQSLVVLQKLLTTVPESAKSGIETAIDAVIASTIETFRQDPAAIDLLLNQHSGSSKIRALLLERIKENAGDENLKQQIELLKAKPAERVKKTKELQAETEKKAKEKQAEQQKETKSPEVKTSEKSEVKTSPSPETKSESTSIELKIKDDGKLEKTSFTVKKGSKLTVKVESEFDSPVTVSLGNSLGSVTVNKAEKKDMTAFTISGTVSFTANGTAGNIYVE